RASLADGGAQSGRAGRGEQPRGAQSRRAGRERGRERARRGRARGDRQGDGAPSRQRREPRDPGALSADEEEGSMRTTTAIWTGAWLIGASVGLTGTAAAQPALDSGSNGSDGALVFEADAGVVEFNPQ